MGSDLIPFQHRQPRRCGLRGGDQGANDYVLKFMRLLVRPAIIDLDVSAPDTMTAGRSRTFTTNTGAMTLYIELHDSVTGAILARAADRKAARNSGAFSLSSSVYNSSEARKMLTVWAELLPDRLSEIRSQTSFPVEELHARS